MDHNCSGESFLSGHFNMKPCNSYVCVKITGRNVVLLAVFDSSYPHGAQLPFLQIFCKPMAQQKLPMPM